MNIELNYRTGLSGLRVGESRRGAVATLAVLVGMAAFGLAGCAQKLATVGQACDNNTQCASDYCSPSPDKVCAKRPGY